MNDLQSDTDSSAQLNQVENEGELSSVTFETDTTIC